MKTIELTVGRNGKSKVEVLGGDGTNCKDMTAAMEQALGAEAGAGVEVELKPEFYETNQQQQFTG